MTDIYSQLICIVKLFQHKSVFSHYTTEFKISIGSHKNDEIDGKGKASNACMTTGPQ